MKINFHTNQWVISIRTVTQWIFRWVNYRLGWVKRAHSLIVKVLALSVILCMRLPTSVGQCSSCTLLPINSLPPWICSNYLKSAIFKHMLLVRLQILFACKYCKIVLRRMPQNTFGDKSTLVQVMTCYRSHYINQCRLWSMSSDGVTWSQWVNGLDLLP